MKKKPLSHLELPNLLAKPKTGPTLPIKKPHDLQCEFFKRFLAQSIQNNELRKAGPKKD